MSRILLLFSITFQFSFSVLAGPFISIGTCTTPEIEDSYPVRILVNVDSESEGFLVGEATPLKDGGPTVMMAENVTLSKLSENEYKVDLDQKSLFGAIHGNLSFIIKKEKTQWAGLNRTYICQSDE